MTIAPISDLRNYGKVLEQVSANSPVYLTRNGRGAYAIHDMADEERFQKAEAMTQLLTKLNEGNRIGEESGWYSDEEIEAEIRAYSRDARDIPVANRIGIARGRLKSPENLDQYNDEIAELFGGTL